MTRTTNARLAGFTFLFYIGVGIAAMVLYGRATSGQGVAAKLASIAQHPTEVRVVVLLTFLQCFSAFVLAVTLYRITHDQDPDLAMLALTFRVAEGVVGGLSIPSTFGLLWLATATGVDAPETATAHAIANFIFSVDAATPLIGATFFAPGSLLFSWLLLRGRMVPVALGWLGVIASVILVIGLALQIAGVLRGAVAQLIWLPMAAFEIPLGVWLLAKGVARPLARESA